MNEKTYPTTKLRTRTRKKGAKKLLSTRIDERILKDTKGDTVI